MMEKFSLRKRQQECCRNVLIHLRWIRPSWLRWLHISYKTSFLFAAIFLNPLRRRVFRQALCQSVLTALAIAQFVLSPPEIQIKYE
jgi:hypothetical protein